MEIGKYYVDGEGFYHVLNKVPNGTTILVIVDAVKTQGHSVTLYKHLPYEEDACDRRMCECKKEYFEKAKEIAKETIRELYNLNTKIFMPLWDEKSHIN